MYPCSITPAFRERKYMKSKVILSNKHEKNPPLSLRLVPLKRFIIGSVDYAKNGKELSPAQYFALAAA